MTADEKNHVISNANDELDRQVLRLDTIFPHIANEISDESRLGSLTHWAYTNRNTVKAAANERPRREAASHRQDLSHAFNEIEAVSREAKREAASARKQRRAHVDSDFDDPRPRKGHVKARGGAHEVDGGATTKRRKVERPAPVDTATAMERTGSGTGSRNTSKDGSAPDVKKRSRAPNSGASRKRYVTFVIGWKIRLMLTGIRPLLWILPLWRLRRLLGRSILHGVLRVPHRILLLGLNLLVTRIPVLRTAASGRRLPLRTETIIVCPLHLSRTILLTRPDKSAESKPAPKEPSKLEHTITTTDMQRTESEYSNNPSKILTPLDTKGENPDFKPTESVEANEPPASAVSNPAPKGRSSKTATPVLPTFAEVQRTRPTRSTDPAPAKRTHKKRGSVSVPQPVISEEESIHGGDDEDDELEPRYCYCNEVSFGEMVACDNDACPREWFHLSCVGLSKPPGKNGKFSVSFWLRVADLSS